MAEGQDSIGIDLLKVEQYAGNGAPDGDIADALGITEDVLTRQCAGLLRRVRAKRRTLLRHAQQEAAMKGNTTMLTWLGKHDLQQDDKHENNAPAVKQYVGVDVEKV
jgi:DNA-binding Lrp family transcriptional regulator